MSQEFHQTIPKKICSCMVCVGSWADCIIGLKTSCKNWPGAAWLLLVAHIFASVQAAVTPWKGGGGQWKLQSIRKSWDLQNHWVCAFDFGKPGWQARSSKHDELSQLPRLGRMLKAGVFDQQRSFQGGVGLAQVKPTQNQLHLQASSHAWLSGEAPKQIPQLPLCQFSVHGLLKASPPRPKL